MYAGPSSQLFVYEFAMPTGNSTTGLVSLGSKALRIPQRAGGALLGARASLKPSGITGNDGTTFQIKALAQIEFLDKRRTLTQSEKFNPFNVMSNTAAGYKGFPLGSVPDSPLYLNWALAGSGYLQVSAWAAWEHSGEHLPCGFCLILETILGPA